MSLKNYLTRKIRWGLETKLIEHHWRNLGDLRDKVLVLSNKGSSVTDPTGTITRVGSVTDLTETATEEDGERRVRIGRFLTLNCARSELIFGSYIT